MLADTVEITFAENNPERFKPTDDVSLRVFFKNVPKVTVKVFEINTTAYYMDKRSEISTAMKLDGMIANEETVLAFESAPIVRTVRRVPLPSLAGRRGVFFVELIGGGVSSRAVIRKGALKVVERLSVAGHVFRVLDEDDNVVDAGSVSLWMAGHHFAADKNGEFVIPYSTGGETAQSLIVTWTDPVTSWTFSTLTDFKHKSESYAFNAGFFVNTYVWGVMRVVLHCQMRSRACLSFACRETLIRDNRKAKVLIRPDLRLMGEIPVPLALLNEVTFTIECTDNEGTPSKKTIQDFKLATDGETEYEFPVPAGLRSLSVWLSSCLVPFRAGCSCCSPAHVCGQFTLTANVKILATGSKQQLQGEYAVSVNGVNGTNSTMDVYFKHGGPGIGYMVALLGKSGEPIANQLLSYACVPVGLVRSLLAPSTAWPTPRLCADSRSSTP